MAAMTDSAPENGFVLPIPEEYPVHRGCMTSESRASSTSTAPQISVAGALYRGKDSLPMSASGHFGRASVDAIGMHAKDTLRPHVAPHPDNLTAPHPRKIERRLRMDYRDVYAGKVFFEKDWQEYTCWRRYGLILSPVVVIKVTMAIAPALITTLLVSMACAIYQGLRGPRMPTLEDTDLMLPYSMVSFALALLLVFKTNTAYARFWEARMMWGATFTYMRQLMVRLMTYCHDAPIPVRKLFVRWVIALPYTMRMHLEEYAEYAGSLEKLLTPAEWAYLLRDAHDGKRRHMPLLALEILSQAINRMHLRSPCQADLQVVMENFMMMCAANERICRTPIPMPYSRHTTRFVITYVAFLPLGLWQHCGFWTLIIAPLITFMLAGIENIGVQIENPFRSGVLPMWAYCATMQHDVLAVAGEWATGTPDGAQLVDEVLKGEPPAWQRHDASTAGDKAYHPTTKGQ